MKTLSLLTTALLALSAYAAQAQTTYDSNQDDFHHQKPYIYSIHEAPLTQEQIMQGEPDAVNASAEANARYRDNLRRNEDRMQGNDGYNQEARVGAFNH